MVTESVGHFVDAEGNEIWICPQCNKPDDGSPMIGCDAGCEDWYHWVCVGIHQEPNKMLETCNTKKHQTKKHNLKQRVTI